MVLRLVLSVKRHCDFLPYMTIPQTYARNPLVSAYTGIVRLGCKQWIGKVFSKQAQCDFFQVLAISCSQESVPSLPFLPLGFFSNVLTKIIFIFVVIYIITFFKLLTSGFRRMYGDVSGHVFRTRTLNPRRY